MVAGPVDVVNLVARVAALCAGVVVTGEDLGADVTPVWGEFVVASGACSPVTFGHAALSFLWCCTRLYPYM